MPIWQIGYAKAVWRAIAPALVLITSGCGPTMRSATALAQAGRIDASAPIRSSRAIVVAAPPPVVWRLLAQVSRWPLWQPAISDVHVAGSVRPGVRFVWTNGGTAIASQMVLVRPVRQMAWTGRASGLTAIHVWTLVPLPNSRTLVRTDESMTGWPSSLFYSSSELDEANAAWLRRLKSAAELTTGLPLKSR